MTRSLASWVDSHAREQPNSTAFVCGAEQLSWAEYSERSSRLAGDLLELGLEAGQRVAVLDFIIRGGKNISGPAVEEAVGTHPDVALAAAVAMPDPVYGERVCVYVELRRGTTLTLEELQKHLAARGISKETFPERLIAVDTLQRSSGDKVAKGELKSRHPAPPRTGDELTGILATQ